MAIQSAQWQKLVEFEYLRRFAPSSGSSIKFVVGEPAVFSELRDWLASYSRAKGFLYVGMDSAVTRLHMMQEVFFAAARAIDWESLAQERVEAAFKELHYSWPKPGSRVPLHEVAVANGVADTLLLNNIDQWLTKHVMHDAAMTSDFREAMTYLCRQRLEPEVSAASLPILEWLRGELRVIGAVRPVPIGAKISRHNARSMLRSLCHWLSLGGRPGIVMTMDLSWLVERAASPAGIRYTPTSILDAFEVIRQLIDETDRLEGVLLVVTAPKAMVDGEDVRRTINQYPALKGRINIDVLARQHDNPLAPLVHVTSTGNGGSEIAVAEMTYSAERVAIEALRAGVPNEAAVRLLGTSEKEWCDRFESDLRQVARSSGILPSMRGRIIAGGFGTGKSHLLGHLVEYAQNQHFIVSLVTISKETPLFNVERVFAAAVRNAIVPDINDDVMSVAISRLDFGSPEFGQLEEWASAPDSGLAPIFAAILYALPRQVLGPEDRVAIARFLGGAKLNTSRLRQWLTALGARKLFDIKPVKASELALQRLRFAPALFRAAGFSGWCVLLDEVELVGRYSSLQRAKSYAELCRWLALDPRVAVPGILSVATIVDDFKTIVVDGRLDQEKLPALLESKALDHLIPLAERGMEEIEKRQHLLAPPNLERLTRDLKIVRGLYERAYAWPPPVSEVGEVRTVKTMREYIKSWITDWDIQRLYNTKDEVTAKPILPTDYTENKNLETIPFEELGEYA
jgi:hypothetical protein